MALGQKHRGTPLVGTRRIYRRSRHGRCRRNPLHLGASARSDRLGELCYAIGLGSLLPLAGLVILVAGEGLRLMRLTGHAPDEAQHSISDRPPPQWSTGLRREAVKWGILATMVVFVVTLKDRCADVLVLASFVIGSLLNLRL